MAKEPERKILRHQRRAARTRAKIRGTAVRPRLSVFRSLQHIAAQLIDDVAGRTIAQASDRELTGTTGRPLERAAAVGKLLAERAMAKKITHVVFDRGSYLFHGRVQAVANGARASGLIF